MENLYALLGVDARASSEEIRAAYRALAQRFHPDHNQGDMAAERRMQEINEAFAVLNAPERRRDYDRRDAAPTSGIVPPGARGAGRGQRPYYRGNNWGLHNGAEAPPQYIVRAAPGGFNLVVTLPGVPPSREVTAFNDAPFTVRMRALCSPWLAASIDLLEVEGGGSARFMIGITPEASLSMRGWRDGGVSLETDDTRVYCPDIRVTAIFMAQGPVTSPIAPQGQDSVQAPADDLRSARDPGRRGWLGRLFGG